MFDNEPLKIYRVTVKTLIKRLEALENIVLDELKNKVEGAFDGYDVDGEEKVVGFELWPNTFENKNYELNVKIDHPDSYEFTLFIKIENNFATVTNVL